MPNFPTTNVCRPEVGLETERPGVHQENGVSLPTWPPPAEAAGRVHSICQLVHGLPIGGAEVLVSRIVRSLRERYRFVIACLDEVGQFGEELAAEGVEVAQLGRRPGLDWRCVRRLGRLFADERIDVVHAHQYTPFAYGVATRAFGRRPPILFTEHGRFYPDRPSLKRKLFNRLLPGTHDRYVAVGQSVRQALIDNEGLPPGRIEIVYNGVDTSSVDDRHAVRDSVRAELGVAADEFLVLQVARLDTIKDHATALRTIALAASRHAEIRLFLAGDGPEKPSIVQSIVHLGLEGRVVPLGMRNDVRRLLAAADAFLLTSVSEGIPVTVLEAMAAGVPVVATAVGGLTEILEDGATGLLAPAGDAAALSDALVRLADDRQLRTRLAAAARCRAQADFSESRMVGRYDQIFQEMLAARVTAS
jgi:sugar transferase (PEP-CTERM/EpsH1 system associated)